MSNILLDELDKELGRRGHKFCRYADDCNIYVRSLKSGQRVLESVTKFLMQKLKLKVNEEKSDADMVEERQFLGYRLLCDSRLTIAQSSIGRIKSKVRELTKRNRAVTLTRVITELNSKLREWINYFKLTERPSEISSLDGWIRRKLRCYRLNQRKKSKSITSFLISLGIKAEYAKDIGGSSKGWWRLSKTPQVHRAMNKKWFNKQGLIDMTNQVALVTA